MYFDVKYISPTNSRGTHHSIKAIDKKDAVFKSLSLLCAHSNYKVSDFRIISVKKIINKSQG